MKGWLIHKRDDTPPWRADILGSMGEKPKPDSRWNVWFHTVGFGFTADVAGFAMLVEKAHGLVWATEMRVRGVEAWLDEVSAPTVLALVRVAKKNLVLGVTYVEDPSRLKPEYLEE